MERSTEAINKIESGQMVLHPMECGCHSCSGEMLSPDQRDDHVRTSESSRRDFLKKFSLSFAMATSGLPLAASALNRSDSEKQSAEMFQNKAVKNGKANIVSILHTADIHAQLLTHDEFFIENGKPVFKKRGGYAVLKTMIDDLRKQNPSNTMLIDGGNCFQGSGIAALSKGAALVPLMNNLNYDLIWRATGR